MGRIQYRDAIVAGVAVIFAYQSYRHTRETQIRTETMAAIWKDAADWQLSEKTRLILSGSCNEYT